MTTCSTCGTENPAGHKFCSNCGSKLGVVCPNCSTANEPGAKFCFECGTGLGEAAPADQTAGRDAQPDTSRTEQRFVSILFADIVGFTSFSEQRDSEDVRAMVTEYFERSKAIIELYGGTVDKFIGDAVMGVWGAGAAHEDDAERATRAALDLVKMVTDLGDEIDEPTLAARAGVLSGATSVGPGGNDKGLVIGDLVNTASRLQSIAPPGGVYVGTSTRDLIDGRIETRAAGAHDVKGKEQAVEAFEALRVISDGGRRSADMLEGPFVGRDDEFRILKDQLHAAGREGRARLVSIVGEGGIGKTRLSQELLRWIDGIAETVFYHHGRSPSYGEGVTFWALGEMIRQRAGIAEGDDSAKARLRLRTMVAEYLPAEEDQRWVEPRLAGIIGIAEMPPGDRGELYAALRAFFQNIAERGTVLMVFEDMHWADDGLIDFVDELVERTTKHPILVVTLSRPDLLERRPDWGSSRKRMLSMHLSRLEPEPMRQLVGGLAPGLPEAIVDRIAERTAGVPLHAVEFIRMLINSGHLRKEEDRYEFSGESVDLTIPDSLSAMIGARLDRLEPAELDLVLDSSVLGYTFSVEALARITDASASELEHTLRDLVRREVFEFDEDPRSPERGQYRFVQSLIREVAYARLTKAEKVARHLAVAEQLASTNDPEVAGVIASHYANASAADPGDAALRQKARSALVVAAERATALGSHRQAVRLLGEAADITDAESDRLSLLVRMSELAIQAGIEDPHSYAEQALKRFVELGDTDGEARAVIAIAKYLSGDFHATEALELIAPVYESFDRGNAVTWAHLSAEMSRALMLADLPDRAVEVADMALPTLAEIGERDLVLEALINRGTALANTDRRTEGYVLLMGVAEYAKRNDLLRPHIRAINNLAAASSADDGRGEVSDEFLDLVHRGGDQSWIMRMPFFIGTARLFMGQFDEALALVDSLDRESATPFWCDWTDVVRCAIQLASSGPSDELDSTYHALVEPYRATDDPQLMETVAAFDSMWAFFSGDLEATRDMALSYHTSFLQYAPPLQGGLFAAGLLRDADAVEVIAEKIKSGPQGAVTTGALGFAGAITALLEGDSESGADAFVSAETIWSDVNSTMSVATAQATFASLIGTDTAIGEQAARDAYAFFLGAGANGILAVFADLFSFIDADDQTTDVAV